MYDNIGGKIKSLAVWTFIVEAIGSIITGIALGCEEDELYFLLCLIGPIVAWVSSWILYAFGEMVEDIHAMRNKIVPNSERIAVEASKREAQNNAAIKKAKKEERKLEEKAKLEAEEKWLEDCYIDVLCPKCGEQLSFIKDETDGICPECGAEFKIK